MVQQMRKLATKGSMKAEEMFSHFAEENLLFILDEIIECCLNLWVVS